MRKFIPCLVTFTFLCLVGLAPAGAQPSPMAPAAPAPSAPSMAVAVQPMAVAPAPMDPAPAPEQPKAPEATPPVAPMTAETSPVSPAEAMASPEAMAGEAVTPKAPEPSTGQTKPTTTTNQDPWWKVLLGGLTTTALTFLSFILLGLGGLLIKWLAKRMKVDDAATVQKFEELYDMAITLGVDYARQMARKLSDDPDANGKKVQWALDMIQKLITDWKLPEKTADWIKARIEAKLGQERKPS